MGKKTKEIGFDRPVILPIQDVAHAMEETIPICWHAHEAILFSRDVIADVVEVAGLLSTAGITGLPNAAIAWPPGWLFVYVRPPSFLCLALHPVLQPYCW